MNNECIYSGSSALTYELEIIMFYSLDKVPVLKRKEGSLRSQHVFSNLVAIVQETFKYKY